MAHILAIAGSPSHPSRTYTLLEYSNQILQQEGFQTDIISVRDVPAEVLAYGRYDSPALEQPKALIERADGIIIATPVYKAAYTGVLKAFLDLLPQRALSGKVVLPIATGGTLAHLLAIDYALKPVLSELKARFILGGVYAIDKQLQIQQDGTVKFDEEIDQRLKEALNEFAESVKSLQPGVKELAHKN
ncbi:NADPH-dependent FMN reductase [Brasilonema sp. UFV-L1]|uniref:NADPH-dependent FMN reductase n=1 Tax=Brasilonema sp. UFV-L1 TaxID=2234130 RepID=UPI00145E8CED|nr:NADPH-dependent FMN reductase [Brasilonema sp. UFV-L1]NMG07922.1 FMN reductase (NADPH) [Brasilonema sp. UFV-L1]